MCLLVPGKLIKLDKEKGVVDYGVEQRQVGILSKKYKVGDYVLVRGGFIIDKVPKKDAEEALRLYAQTRQSD